jgi:hypothetical protein
MNIQDKLEEMIKRPYCNACQKKRGNFKKEDQSYHGKHTNRYSRMMVGFNRGKISELNPPIDILFVLESVGGGREEDFKPDFENVEESADYLRQYYLSKPIEKFHQSEIRKILTDARIYKKTYFVTDLVKCFVAKEKGNFIQAAKECKKYLQEQIDFLQPKILVLFGRLAQDAVKTLNKPARCQVIELRFPSQRTADDWTKECYEKNSADLIMEKLVDSPVVEP